MKPVTASHAASMKTSFHGARGLGVTSREAASTYAPRMKPTLSSATVQRKTTPRPATGRKHTWLRALLPRSPARAAMAPRPPRLVPEEQLDEGLVQARLELGGRRHARGGHAGVLEAPAERRLAAGARQVPGHEKDETR